MIDALSLTESRQAERGFYPTPAQVASRMLEGIDLDFVQDVPGPGGIEAGLQLDGSAWDGAEGGTMTMPDTEDYIVFDRTGTPHVVVAVKTEIGGNCPQSGNREVEG